MSTKEIVEEFVRDPEMIKFFHSDNWKEESAELRGREEGREEGLELGREEEKLETAKEMLKNNCDINFISKITKLSVPKIKALL